MSAGDLVVIYVTTVITATIAFMLGWHLRGAVETREAEGTCDE